MTEFGIRRILGRLLSFAAAFPFLLVAIAEAKESIPEKPTEAAKELSLRELCAFKKNSTDKCPRVHNYVGVYDVFLRPIRHTATDILEIGVFKGRSMRLWADYFSKATIHGVDILDTSDLELPIRVRTYIGDQAKRDDLRSVVVKAGKEFDVILDDGGHTMKQQQISMGFLFPYVKKGGYYIIEDVHTSFVGHRGKFGADKDGKNSTLTMISRYNYHNKISSEYMTQEEADYIEKHTEYCNLVHVSKRPSLAWICKKN